MSRNGVQVALLMETCYMVEVHMHYRGEYMLTMHGVQVASRYKLYSVENTSCIA